MALTSDMVSMGVRFLPWELGFGQSSSRHSTRTLQHMSFHIFHSLLLPTTCSFPLHLSDPGRLGDPNTSISSVSWLCQGYHQVRHGANGMRNEMHIWMKCLRRL